MACRNVLQMDTSCCYTLSTLQSPYFGEEIVSVLLLEYTMCVLLPTLASFSFYISSLCVHHISPLATEQNTLFKKKKKSSSVLFWITGCSREGDSRNTKALFFQKHPTHKNTTKRNRLWVMVCSRGVGITRKSISDWQRLPERPIKLEQQLQLLSRRHTLLKDGGRK